MKNVDRGKSPRSHHEQEKSTMARITVVGGTGYAGSNVVEVAAARGHEVVSYSRNLPEQRVEGVDHRAGDVVDDAVLRAVVENTDVVVSALSPRGALAGEGVLRRLEARLAERAEQAGARFGVVGGAGSLLVAEGGPEVVDTDGFPDEFKPEAREMAGVLADLRANQGLDWFFVSPAANFGPWAAGELTGAYRLGGDVLLTDDEGNSDISGPDLALALVKEIEEPAHRRTRFSVAY
jgi:putative NADH-flavin reductase